MTDLTQQARELFAEWHRARGCGDRIIKDCLSGVIQMPELAQQLVAAALSLRTSTPDAGGRDALLQIEGRIVEMGNLEGYESPTPGLRIEARDQVIDIAGLSRQQIASMPASIFKHVTIAIAQRED